MAGELEPMLEPMADVIAAILEIEGAARRLGPARDVFERIQQMHGLIKRQDNEIKQLRAEIERLKADGR